MDEINAIDGNGEKKEEKSLWDRFFESLLKNCEAQAGRAPKAARQKQGAAPLAADFQDKCTIKSG